MTADTSAVPDRIVSDKARSYHMSAEQFRQHGRSVVDWIADYWEGVEERPVFPDTKPGDTLDKLPLQAPLEGESFEVIMRDFNELIMPAMTNWQSPNFFAYFTANTSPVSVLGEAISAALSPICFQWAGCPAATELEMRVMDWLVDLKGMPAAFKFENGGGGVIQDTSSIGTLCALVAAREKATADIRQQTIYVSSETHNHVVKDARVAGIPNDNIRFVDTDDVLGMSVEHLELMIKEDLAAGLCPSFMTATVGTTSTCAVDPLAAIGKVCAKYGIWLHLDAAMAGVAAICPEYRDHFANWENVDSYTFNPHKWMFTNMDCACLFVRDRKVLKSALNITSDYLRNDYSDVEDSPVVDYRDWTIQLGRRMRALKLWFVLRSYGVEGLRYHIRRHLELTREFVSWVEQSDQFELVMPTNFNLVCLRHKSDDETNIALLKALNASGKIHLTHTKVNGQFVLRMHISQRATELRHIRAAWELISSTAAELHAKAK